MRSGQTDDSQVDGHFPFDAELDSFKKLEANLATIHSNVKSV